MTLAELLEAWSARDARYTRAGRALSDAEIRIIRLGRAVESIEVPPSDRLTARSLAWAWDPPAHAR